MGHSTSITPYPQQYPFLYKPELPLNPTVIVAHRRAGKSVGYVLRLVKKIYELLQMKEPHYVGDTRVDYPKFGYFANTREQARDIVWIYLLEYLRIFHGAYFNNQRLTVQIPRPKCGDYITVALKSARDYNSVRGDRFYELFLDEYQDYPTEAYPVIYSALTDLEGCLYISGTAKGKDNNLYKLMYDILNPEHHRGGSVNIYNVYNTNKYNLDQQKEIRANMSEEAWAREYELNFNVSYGETYYSEFISKFSKDPTFHWCYDENLPLGLAVDIGVGKSFAAWLFQVHNGHPVLLDYYENYSVLSSLRDDIKANWGEREVDVMFLPHDGKKRQISATKVTKIRDVFEEAFPQTVLIPIKKSTRVENDRALIKENFAIFRYYNQLYGGIDKPTDLPLGLSKLSQYGPKTNASGVITAAVDRSTGVDHCADAFRHIVLGLKIKNLQVHRDINILSKRRSAPEVILPTWQDNTGRRRGQGIPTNYRNRRRNGII